MVDGLDVLVEKGAKEGGKRKKQSFFYISFTGHLVRERLFHPSSLSFFFPSFDPKNTQMAISQNVFYIAAKNI